MFEVVEEQCQWILTFWIRIFIFCFYQFQFMKPVFFLAMDKDLRKGLKTLIFGDKHHKFAKSKKMIIIWVNECVWSEFDSESTFKRSLYFL